MRLRLSWRVAVVFGCAWSAPAWATATAIDPAARGAPAPALAVPAPTAPASGEATPASSPPVATGSPGLTFPAQPASLIPPAIEEESPKPVITLHVDIDLSAQRMTVRSEGDVIHSWPISSGRRGYSTPPGTYQPQWRARMWRSRQYYGAPMPHSVFFHRGYAVHGTDATGMLGRPASHGCIRLAPKNAAMFYNLVGKHGMASTRIVVRGSARNERIARSRSQRPHHAERVVRRAPSGYARYGYGSPNWWSW